MNESIVQALIILFVLIFVGLRNLAMRAAAASREAQARAEAAAAERRGERPAEVQVVGPRPPALPLAPPPPRRPEARPRVPPPRAEPSYSAEPGSLPARPAPAELRRVVVMMEVFRPPVALREASQGGAEIP